jgi:hypothetical protein
MTLATLTRRLWPALLAVMVSGCGSPLVSTVAGQPDVRPMGGRPALAAPSPLRIDPRLPIATGTRSATVLNLVLMDDPLSRFGERYLNAVEAATAPNVYELAMADFLGPDNSALYRLQADPDRTRLTSPRSRLNPDTAEVASNDPAVIAAVTDWAFESYPSAFRALSVQSHGFGYGGLGTDATQPGGQTRGTMSLLEFGAALREGLSGRKLQLISMLSCLMGTVESAYELRDIAEVLVASEATIAATDDTTVRTTEALHRLLAQPRPDARRIAEQITTIATDPSKPAGYISISAIDLTRMQRVADAVSQLADTLLAAMPTQSGAILAAYDAVPVIATDATAGQRDLLAFAHSLQRVPDAKVQAAIRQVNDAVVQAMLLSRNRMGTGANGLGICLPTRADFARPDMRERIEAGLRSRFARDTGWDRVIATIREAQGTPGTGSVQSLRPIRR